MPMVTTFFDLLAGYGMYESLSKRRYGSISIKVDQPHENASAV